MDTQEFIAALLEAGFSLSQVSDAASDGELLGLLGINEAEAEEIYYTIKEMR